MQAVVVLWAVAALLGAAVLAVAILGMKLIRHLAVQGAHNPLAQRATGHLRGEGGAA